MSQSSFQIHWTKQLLALFRNIHLFVRSQLRVQEQRRRRGRHPTAGRREGPEEDAHDQAAPEGGQARPLREQDHAQLLLLQ